MSVHLQDINQTATGSATVNFFGRTLNLSIYMDEGTLYVLDEIFKKRCYDIVPFVNDIQTIMDIGANVGIGSAWFRLAYPHASIVAFEPDPKAQALLRENMKVIGGITLHPVGLFDEDRTQHFFTGKQSTVHSSIYANRYSATDSFIVELKETRSFLQSVGITGVDLLKIDTEGCELAILRNMGDMIQATKIIYLEFHSEDDRRDIDDLLHPTHQLYSGNILQAHRGQFTYVRRDLLSLQIDPNIEALNTSLLKAM